MARKKQSKIQLIPQYHGGYKDRAGRQYTKEEGTRLLNEGKATRAQWKGGKTAKETFEGGQYRGGRKAGSGNLKRVDGGYQNKHGVVFTEAQKKALESAVNKVNYKRTKMLKEEGNLPRLVGGKDTGQKVSQLQLMGKESDFIISRKSKSLQQFKSMADYEKYLERMEYIRSDAYIDDRTRFYKRNHMKAIENVFGDEAKDVLMKIRMMKPAEYRELIQKDEMLEVNYVYDPSARTGKLNQIRASLGMNLKEDSWDEDDLPY